MLTVTTLLPNSKQTAIRDIARFGNSLALPMSVDENSKQGGDELRDITESLEKQRTETTHVHTELDAMLDELQTITKHKPTRPPKAA